MRQGVAQLYQCTYLYGTHYNIIIFIDTIPLANIAEKYHNRGKFDRDVVDTYILSAENNLYYDPGGLM